MLIYNDEFKTEEELTTISVHNAEHLKDRALELWHDLNECTLSSQKTNEVQEYIINLFGDIN